MIRRAAGLAILCLLVVAPARAEEDALPIVMKAFEAARENEAVLRNYVFQERLVQVRYNKKGREKKREARTYDVTLLDNSEYRRLIAIDDKPLFEKTEMKEQKRLEKQLKKMRNETPTQRARRLAKIEKGREEGEKFLEEITRGFDFRLIGEEEIDGIATHVISAEPKPGFEPSTRDARVLAKIRGKLWISREEFAWVKADLEVFENVRFAVIFKLKKGAEVRFTQRRLNDEVWVPDNWNVRFRSRVALVAGFNGEFSGTYSNYRRFTTDSQVIEEEATP